MTTFKRHFADAVEQHCIGKDHGENGMLQYNDRDVGSDLLALNQLVRDGSVEAQVDAIRKRNDPDEVADLFVLIFATRNTRGGKGEKKLAYDMLFRLWDAFPLTAARLVPLFVHYGYWKDLFLLLEEGQKTLSKGGQAMLRKAVIETTAEQLRQDIVTIATYKADPEAAKHPNVSLLSKWLPREGSSLDKKTGFVKDLVRVVWPSERVVENPKAGNADGVMEHSASEKAAWKSARKARYRKTVAELTSYLDLPEVLLAAKREDEINFARLASKAGMRLRKVFLNQDKHGRPRSEDPKRIRLAERFSEHVLAKGLNGKQLMPHEIVHKIMHSNVSRKEALVLDAMWKSLWAGVVEQVEAKACEKGGSDFDPTRMIPMADVSGSMSGIPMEVSIAMSIGLSEITHPAFQNLVLTFSSTPSFHKLMPGATIVEKVHSLRQAEWGTSTNFEAAYDLILDLVVENELRREDMPALIVFSDMQFNQASRGRRLDVMHDVICRKVDEVARQLGWSDNDPTPIVYWNLRNTGGHPVNKGTEGTVLLAGYSPSLLRMVMGGDALVEEEVEVVQADGTVKTEKVRVTPEQILRNILDDSMYDPVRAILSTSEEGILRDYKPSEPVQDEDGFDVI